MTGKQKHSRNYEDVFTAKPQQKLKDIRSELLKIILKPYEMPISLQKEVDRQIKQLLEMGLIEPNDSKWIQSVVSVVKKNEAIRLYLDFQLLNSFAIPGAYPIKRAKDLLFVRGL